MHLLKIALLFGAGQALMLGWTFPRISCPCLYRHQGGKNWACEGLVRPKSVYWAPTPWLLPARHVYPVEAQWRGASYHCLLRILLEMAPHPFCNIPVPSIWFGQGWLSFPASQGEGFPWLANQNTPHTHSHLWLVQAWTCDSKWANQSLPQGFSLEVLANMFPSLSGTARDQEGKCIWWWRSK